MSEPGPVRIAEAFGVCSVREDTELLARVASEAGPVGRALDLGTGTGYVAIQLALAGWDVDAVDVSPRALALARRNVRANGVRVRLLHSDLYCATPGPYDLVVSNPPQRARETELSRMATSTLRRSPRLSNALQSLLRPLLEPRRRGFLEAIARGALERLAPDGSLVLVISPNEASRLVDRIPELTCQRIIPVRNVSGMAVVTFGSAGEGAKPHAGAT